MDDTVLDNLSPPLLFALPVDADATVRGDSLRLELVVGSLAFASRTHLEVLTGVVERVAVYVLNHGVLWSVRDEPTQIFVRTTT